MLGMSLVGRGCLIRVIVSTAVSLTSDERAQYGQVIPLDKNEGIYVRDTKTGTVRAVVGESYLLKPSEVRCQVLGRWSCQV